MDVAQIAKGLSVGIIMDGNGRWAKKRGLPRNAGHKKGAEVFSDLVHYCNELELAAVTFYAFSTENWKRPQSEVAGIMRLFREYLVKAFDYEKENNRVVFLGDRTPLDAESQRLMAKIEESTRHKTGMILNIAINYGGRDELVCAARQLAELVRDGKLAAKDITAEAIQQHLYTHGQPDPDLIVAIDALAARSCERLAATVQLSDCGISPGSGIGNCRRAIDRRTTGAPVLSVGVPTVVDSATLVYDALEQAGIREPDASLKQVLENGRRFYVSPKESDRITGCVSKVLASALNEAFGTGNIGGYYGI